MEVTGEGRKAEGRKRREERKMHSAIKILLKKKKYQKKLFDILPLNRKKEQIKLKISVK